MKVTHRVMRMHTSRRLRLRVKQTKWKLWRKRFSTYGDRVSYFLPFLSCHDEDRAISTSGLIFIAHSPSAHGVNAFGYRGVVGRARPARPARLHRVHDLLDILHDSQILLRHLGHHDSLYRHD